MKNIIIDKRGMSMLIVMIVVATVALLVGTTVALASLDEEKIGLHHGGAIITLTATEGCAEHALSSLRIDDSYLGEVLSINGVTCTITVSGAGLSRTLSVQSIRGGMYTRNIEIMVDWNSIFTITSWQEITI
jgi:hypothetical protein